MKIIGMFAKRTDRECLILTVNKYFGGIELTFLHQIYQALVFFSSMKGDILFISSDLVNQRKLPSFLDKLHELNPDLTIFLFNYEKEKLDLNNLSNCIFMAETVNEGIVKSAIENKEINRNI